MNTRFEWDPVKASINVRKHGISFDIALRVFADPLALTNLVGIEGGEERWQTIGVVEDYLLLLVAHTTREEDEDGQLAEIIRIVSARTADRKERQRYEQEIR
ncbi:MAG TPA: BrnT family toxin [Steroidobacteraceae bacterium]|jgi:uncharacterized DUF497 family protein|nr:BrnT family toxin [Steroidobacteraceae bacterium]